MSKNASAVDQAFFDVGKNPNLMDFDEIARINKEIEDYGESELGARFYDSNKREKKDWAKMIIPSIIGSMATLARSGWDEIGASGVVGGVTGLVSGLVSGPGAVATGAAGLGLGVQAGTAAAAAEMEYMLSIMDELKEKGVDITNPDALRKAWSNKGLMQSIRSNSLKRTGVVLAADLVGGVGGQAVNVYRKTRRVALKALRPGYKVSKFAKAKDEIIETAIEGTAGMTGETGAILATKGKITAEDVPGIVMEGLGEAPAISMIGSPITKPLGRYAQQKLTDFANRNAPPAAIPPAGVPPVAADRGSEAVAVTQEEFDDFTLNNRISEARAAGVADDAQLALQDGTHMEKLMQLDPLYAGMVEKFIEKGIAQQEVATFSEAARLSIADKYNLTDEEFLAATTDGSPSFNKEIADAYNLEFSRLYESYKADDQTGTTTTTTTTNQTAPAGQTAQVAPVAPVVQADPLAPAEETPVQGTRAEVGQVVQIDGKRYYVKDEGGGKLVVETEDGKILEIPSNNPTIESIGATLLREAQKDKNYAIQVDNDNTATINGEKYTITRDKQGNVIGAQNQRRGNVSLTKPEVLGELQRQLGNPELRQPTTVSVQQPLTQVNETVQPTGTTGTTVAAQSESAPTEVAGETTATGDQTTEPVQPGTETATETVGETVSGVNETERAMPSIEEYDKMFKAEGLKKGDRSKNKAEFSAQHGPEVYEAMRKLNDNFTRITNALEKDGRLQKKC